MSNVIDVNRNLSVSIPMFGIDLYSNNMNLFAEGQADYRFLKNRIWIEANYKFAFFEDGGSAVTVAKPDWGIPVGGLKPLQQLFGSVGYNIVKKEFTRFMRVPGYDSLPALPIRSASFYGIHAGYSRFRTIVSSPAGFKYSAPADISVVPEGFVKFMASPMLQIDILYLGFHRQRVAHYVVKAEVDGQIKKFRDRSIRTLKAELMFGTNSVLSDLLLVVNSPNAPTLYQANINGSLKINPIGWRLAWEHLGLAPTGVIAGFETGMLPGPFAPLDNFFLLMKVGLRFNTRL